MEKSGASIWTCHGFVDLSRFDAATLIAFAATRETDYVIETGGRIPARCRVGCVDSGLARKQVANDQGVGLSTLNKWITARRGTDVVSKEDLSLARENDRLRRENRRLKYERKISKGLLSSSRAKSHEV